MVDVSNVTGRRVLVFDTTLRDGEQAPGCSMNISEKLAVAAQLERLGVDVIEAGFAAASPGDAEAVRAVARAVHGCVVGSLARALESDIDAAWDSLRDAEKPLIHTFIATSPVHMEYKLRMGPDEVVERARSAVRYAKRFCPDVEFSAEDASRSDPDFLCRVFRAVIEEGATTINIPDTVGYAVPDEFAALVRRVVAEVGGPGGPVISVHCHNDLGLAVANSLAAVGVGAGQIECTVNGLGERAGNAALEEVAMALRTRPGRYGAYCGVDTTQIYKASRLVSASTGTRVPPNKAIVGENAFAHEAGIHQHGILANRETYEIMTPESIGLPKSRLVLGKHSGRHAFDERLAELGLSLAAEDATRLFEEFKVLADKKKGRERPGHRGPRQRRGLALPGALPPRALRHQLGLEHRRDERRQPRLRGRITAGARGGRRRPDRRVVQGDRQDRRHGPRARGLRPRGGDGRRRRAGRGPRTHSYRGKTLQRQGALDGHHRGEHQGLSRGDQRGGLRGRRDGPRGRRVGWNASKRLIRPSATGHSARA
jgi:2-isopropylmalate synthase